MVSGRVARISLSHLIERCAGPLSVAASILLATAGLDRGWVPHDTGQLGHTAERVLAGELQHRDFDEPYSGGLGQLHALAYRVLGVRAEAMRWVLLVYFALFIGTIYALARRVAAPAVASLVTLVCASVSIPIYSASMPSWYNLFFATFGLAALAGYLDTGRRRWLFWAGCCAGCSLLMKITGLYFVAASLLLFGYLTQGNLDSRQPRSRVFSLLMFAACAAVIAASLVFLPGSRPLSNVVHFVLPLVVLSGYVAWREWALARGRCGERFGAAVKLLVPYLCGAAVVITLFLVPYAAGGALDDLFRGLFILPQARLNHAAMAPPPAIWLVASVPLAAVWLAGSFAGRLAGPPRYTVIGLVAFGCLTWIVSGSAAGYFVLFQAVRNLIPLFVLVGVFVLARAGSRPEDSLLFLIVSVTALASLIQYPYAYGVYFFYAAPLLVLGLLYVAAWQQYSLATLRFGLLVLAVLFGIFRLPQPDPRLMNGFTRPDLPLARLELPRCGLRVYREDARLYNELVSMIQAHSRPGEPIYAGPDCPEVYFLANRRNPTRTLYDLFESPTRSLRPNVLSLVQRGAVRVVIVNHRPAFSTGPDPKLIKELARHFPRHRDLFWRSHVDLHRQRAFTVFWRGQADWRPDPLRDL